MLRFVFALCVVIASWNGSVCAALIPASFTGTAEGSWRYSEEINAGHGGSTTYFATTLAEFEDVEFQGYVTYNVGPPPLYWFGQGTDSIQVFSTYLMSDTTRSVPVLLGGDDGHSLFINHVFIGGGGYGDAGVNATLSLQAGVPLLIEIVGYNGPGPFAFSLRTVANDTVLDDVPGLHLNADGAFVVVPEPTTAVLWSLAVAIGTALGRRTKKASTPIYG